MNVLIIAWALSLYLYQETGRSAPVERLVDWLATEAALELLDQGAQLSLLATAAWEDPELQLQEGQAALLQAQTALQALGEVER